MIRIGAGTLAGRILELPKTAKTRPLTQKVRASIFNRLGDISGLNVLDAYAGSGAFGIEALSLGADHVTFVEQTRSTAQVITHNLETMNVASGAHVCAESVRSFLDKNDQPFDIILADPPYKELQEGEVNLLFKYLLKNGIGIVSHSARMPSPKLESAEFIDARTYGDTTISYYRGKIG